MKMKTVTTGWSPKIKSAVTSISPSCLMAGMRTSSSIRSIVSRWAPESENNTRAYIENVSRLTGIDPDEPIGIPSAQPARWMMVGVAMAIQENGTTSIDWFAMLRGWELYREDIQVSKH